jgi:hypothetical protein
VVLLLLPLSPAINDGEFKHNGGSGSSGVPVAVAASVVAVVDDDWCQKWPATIALMGA